MINVVEIDKNNFEVEIQNEIKSVHKVYLSDVFFEKYKKKYKSKKDIVHESFKFLLEREDNTTILKRFDIEVIKDFFPEYEKFLKNNYDTK